MATPAWLLEYQAQKAGDPLALPAQPDTIETAPTAADGSPLIVVRPKPQAPSIPSTIFDQTMQGATGNFADEVTDPIGALLATLMQDPGAIMSGESKNPALNDALANARADTQAKLSAEQSQNPVTSFLSNVGGIGLSALGPGGLLKSGAQKLAPKLATNIGQIAKANPKIAAAIVGALGNDLYSIGQGSGDLGQRSDNILTNTGFGAAGGFVSPPLAKAAGRVIRPIINVTPQPIKNMVSAVADRFSNDPIAPPPSQAALAQPLGPLPAPNSFVNQNDLLNLGQGKTIPMTLGDRTQNPARQAIEDQALRTSDLGGDRRMLDARSIQQDALHSPFQKALGDNGGLLGTPDRLIDSNFNDTSLAKSAADQLNNKYNELDQAVSAAYKKADEFGGAHIPVDQISPNDAGTSLLDRIGTTLSVEGVTAKQMPDLIDAVSDLQSIANHINENNQTATTIRELEKWKKTKLNRIDPEKQGGIKGPEAKRILALVNKDYKEFLDYLGENSLVTGDEKAIEAFVEARGLASKQFKFYESDKIIKNIIDKKELSGVNLANMLFGASKFMGKGEDGRIAETMIELAGDKGPEMQNALKQGIMARIYQRSMTKTIDPVMKEKGIDRAILSPAYLLDNMRDLMRNKETFQAVFDQNEQEFLKGFTKELADLASRQPGAVNNSNTWTFLAKYLNHVTPPGFGLKTALQLISSKSLEISLSKKAAKGLGEFFPDLIKSFDAPPAFYGYIGGIVPTKFNNEGMQQ